MHGVQQVLRRRCGDVRAARGRRSDRRRRTGSRTARTEPPAHRRPPRSAHAARSAAAPAARPRPRRRARPAPRPPRARSSSSASSGTSRGATLVSPIRPAPASPETRERNRAARRSSSSGSTASRRVQPAERLDRVKPHVDVGIVERARSAQERRGDRGARRGSARPESAGRRRRSRGSAISGSTTSMSVEREQIEQAAEDVEVAMLLAQRLHQRVDDRRPCWRQRRAPPAGASRPASAIAERPGHRPRTDSATPQPRRALHRAR